jgi:hypothetical protein
MSLNHYMDREPIETVEYHGYTIKIWPDESPEFPREWDNLGTMACWHKRYELGDRQPELPPEEYIAEIEKAGDLILPLYLYEHGGLTMNTTGFSCPWDSGQIGVIHVSKARLKEEYSTKRITQRLLERARRCLMAEVDNYDKYLTGDVGYEIEGLIDESCWGYYDIGEAITDAKSYIDWHNEDARKKKIAQTKTYIKHHVPLEARK